MEKYYKIPMTERLIAANDVALIKILEEEYGYLYDREIGRIKLTYGSNTPKVMTPQLEEEIKEYNQQTAQKYKDMCVPQYIIAVKENGAIREYETGAIITARGAGLLDVREVSKEEVTQYLQETEEYYFEETSKFFQKEKNKCFVKGSSETIQSKKDN